MRAAGLDGCRGGWVLARRDADGVPQCTIIRVLEEVTGLDCDLEARRFLGGRGASVFPAPVRAVLEVEGYAEANALHRMTDGRGLSRQSWNLLPKIREADALARRSAAWRARLCEVHPELSFALMAGGLPMPAGKRSEAGRRMRREALVVVFGESAVAGAQADREPAVAQVDDVLDALAVLWSAERLLGGVARSFGEGAGPDGAGLPMRIAA